LHRFTPVSQWSQFRVTNQPSKAAVTQIVEYTNIVRGAKWVMLVRKVLTESEGYVLVVKVIKRGFRA
jgi:hypothetical protein